MIVRELPDYSLGILLNDFDITCQWFEGKTLKSGKFHPDTLMAAPTITKSSQTTSAVKKLTKR